MQACVLDEAASNGWATVDEVTALNCANSDITDLAGLEALTDLDTLDLSGNTDILCTALDALELALPNTAITRPATCDTGVTDSSQQVQNLHNALGQRVVKTVNGDANTAIHFLYDQSGQVIAEIDATTGTTLREYIYVNGQQIAIVDDTGTQEEATYFVHNDHLGTPQKITDETQAIVWDATYKPFGEVEVATEEIENNIRFPGQYADEETGLNYNYFRDYDPSTGRYVESDPIGHFGGLQLFLYANQNPVRKLDFYGLATTGSWLTRPSLSIDNLDVNWMDSRFSPPSISYWGYLKFIHVSGSASGSLNIDVQCSNDCDNWQVHNKIDVNFQGTTKIGPNLIALGFGIASGPWTGFSANVAIASATALQAELYFLQQLQSKGGSYIDQILAQGPTVICIINSK